jgi:hypothetical protein
MGEMRIAHERAVTTSHTNNSDSSLVWRTQPDKFRTPPELRNGNLARWRVVSERVTDGRRTLSGCLADGGAVATPS